MQTITVKISQYINKKINQVDNNYYNLNIGEWFLLFHASSAKRNVVYMQITVSAVLKSKDKSLNYKITSN